MALTLDKSVLERIESLQNIMLAGVTGGARDEAEYRQIREELLRVPGLKDALPLSCGTSSKPNRTLAAMQAAVSSFGMPFDHSWLASMTRLASSVKCFFVKGSDYDAYVHIRNILQTAKADLFVIDPYMDGSIYQVLGTLTPTSMNMRILTSKHPVDFALETRKFAKQHAGFAAEVRTTRDFHDRFIILDRTGCYLPRFR